MNMLSSLKFSVKQIHWFRKCVAFVMIIALSMTYLLKPLEAQGGIYRIEMSPSGQKIAVVTSNGILIYDINLNLISEPPGRDAITWSPDSRYLAIWGGGIFVRIWDTAINQVISEFEEEGGSKMAWSPLGDKLAINFASRVRIYAPFTGQLLTELETSTPIIQAIAWHPDGELLAVSTPTSAEVHVWDVITNQHLHTVSLADDAYDLAWSPDGSQLAIADDPAIVIWDTSTTQIAKTLTGHTQQAHQLNWHEIKGLTSLSTDGSIRVWDVENGTQVNQFPIDGTSVRTFAWTLDGQFLILPDAESILTKVPIGVSCDFSPGDPTQLIADITTANGTPEPDTICLTDSATYPFTTAHIPLNALPVITSEITIIGNGATLTRQAGAPLFGFFEVSAGGNLTLENLTLNGGALVNEGGTVTLNNVTFSNNH